MKKFLLPLLFLLSYLPSQATQSSTSQLQKCLGATALLLSRLYRFDDIRDEDYTRTSLNVLNILRKELDNRQAASDLYDAIDKSDYKKAIRLLKDKPTLAINARFSLCKSTALMQCCDKGDNSIDVVKDILEHPKFDITVTNMHESTCLHYACAYGIPKITSLLLKREDIGKILHAIDEYIFTPLDCIVFQIKGSEAYIGHVNVWNMMVTKGAQLSYYKKEYKQLNSDDFKPPYSDYIDLIKSTPPKKVKVFKEPFLGRKMNSKQEDESKEKK